MTVMKTEWLLVLSFVLVCITISVALRLQSVYWTNLSGDVGQKYILAASVDGQFLKNLKFAKLNCLQTVLMWVLKPRLESVFTPRYLYLTEIVS